MSEPDVRAATVPADPMGRVLDRLSRLLAFVGGLLLVAMTLMATYSIAMRTLFDEPLLGDVELVQMGCGIAIVFFCRCASSAAATSSSMYSPCAPRLACAARWMAWAAC